MRCPYCKANNDRVVDSRTSGEADVIRRRRECLECDGRFTTYEKAGEATLRVVKKDGTRVPFDRDKLLSGLHVACHKRPVETGTLESIVTDIESQLHEMFDKEVASKFIGHLVMDALRGLDQVAYVRFASVYREFKDVNQFLDELKPLLASGDSDSGGQRPHPHPNPQGRPPRPPGGSAGPGGLGSESGGPDGSPDGGALDTPNESKPGPDDGLRGKGPSASGGSRTRAREASPAAPTSAPQMTAGASASTSLSASGTSTGSSTGGHPDMDGDLRAPKR